MADYYVCSDNIDGKENSRIDALVKALEEKGHTATNGGVGPNTIQSHGQESSSSGQIGVFICGGVDIQVFWDFVQGIGSYYHYKRFIYVYASDTATTDKWLTCNGAKNTPTVQAWDDNYSGGQGDAIGKTVDAYCNEHKDKIWYACGSMGCDFQEVIDNFLKGEGAGDSDSGESTSGSTIKDALKQAVGGDGTNGWDGEAEIRIEGDTVYVNRIPDPTTTKLVANEYENVQYDSVTVTDLNPQTPNKITMAYEGQTLVLKDDHMIERFEENPVEVEPDEFVKSYADAVSFLQREWNKARRGDGRQVELKVQGGMEWKTGTWVRVYLPSFKIDDYMYIVRCSHDEDGTGNWTANLTLEDYPPSLGLYSGGAAEEETDEEETDEETTDEDGETTDTETTEESS